MPDLRSRRRSARPAYPVPATFLVWWLFGSSTEPCGISRLEKPRWCRAFRATTSSPGTGAVSWMLSATRLPSRSRPESVRRSAGTRVCSFRKKRPQRPPRAAPASSRGDRQSNRLRGAGQTSSSRRTDSPAGCCIAVFRVIAIRRVLPANKGMLDHALSGASTCHVEEDPGGCNRPFKSHGRRSSRACRKIWPDRFNISWAADVLLGRQGDG